MDQAATGHGARLLGDYRRRKGRAGGRDSESNDETADRLATSA
jgi:hypothetical protein